MQQSPGFVFLLFHEPLASTSSVLAPPISRGGGSSVGVSFGGVGLGAARRGSAGNTLLPDQPHGGSAGNTDADVTVVNVEDYVALQLEVARLREVGRNATPLLQ